MVAHHKLFRLRFVSLCFLFFEHDDEADDVEQRDQSDHDECCAQEVVFTTKRSDSGQDKGLLALESGDIEVVLDLERVFAGLETILYFSVQLSEVRQCSCSHPDNEVLVGHVNPLQISPVFSVKRVRNGFLLNVLEFDVDIGGPRDLRVVNGDVGSVGLVVELERVVEVRFGDEAAGDRRP